MDRTSASRTARARRRTWSRPALPTAERAGSSPSSWCASIIALIALVLSSTPVDADEYKYPYRDPYLATVTASILNSDRLSRSRRLTHEVVRVPGLSGRNRLPGLEGRGDLSVALYRQNRPAPLVFIVSGIGSSPYFGLATYYARLLQKEGSHVVIL